MLLCFIWQPPSALCRVKGLCRSAQGLWSWKAAVKSSHYEPVTKKWIINGKYVQVWMQPHPITYNLREMMCAKCQPPRPPPLFKYEFRRFTQLNTLVTHWLRFLEKKRRLTTARDGTVRSCLTFYSCVVGWSYLYHHCVSPLCNFRDSLADRLRILELSLCFFFWIPKYG